MQSEKELTTKVTQLRLISVSLCTLYNITASHQPSHALYANSDRTSVMAFFKGAVSSSVRHGIRHGFKTGGGPQTIIELESEPKFNINLFKII